VIKRLSHGEDLEYLEKPQSCVVIEREGLRVGHGCWKGLGGPDELVHRHAPTGDLWHPNCSWIR